MRNGSSIMGLVKELKQEAKLFLREEVQLAETEMLEKLSSLGHNTLSVTLSGFVAYAGLIVSLCGVGALLAFLFTRMGLDPLQAGCAGLGIIGLVVMGVGAVMLMNGLEAFKKESPTPSHTIGTLQLLMGEAQSKGPGLAEEKEPKDQRTSEQIGTSVVEAEGQMAETTEELAERVSPAHAWRQAMAEVRNHPYLWGLVAARCGAAGSYMLKRKLSR